MTIVYPCTFFVLLFAAKIYKFTIKRHLGSYSIITQSYTEKTQRGVPEYKKDYEQISKKQFQPNIPLYPFLQPICRMFYKCFSRNIFK